MTTFADDIKAQLISLNDLHEENKKEFYEKLNNFIEFHAIAKQ